MMDRKRLRRRRKNRFRPLLIFWAMKVINRLRLLASIVGSGATLAQIVESQDFASCAKLQSM
jgi:hypothetical protein